VSFFDERAGKLARARRLLSGWSRELANHAHQIASQSDHWFLSVVEGIERGAQSAQTGLGKLVVSLPGLGSSESPRQRIQRLLQAEAQKQGYDAGSREFELFSERIAIVVELVLTGAVKVEDIAFEPGVSETAPENGQPPPAQ
jgi:hypothetical protein